METTFARIYNAWLSAKALNPETAAAQLGIGKTASYEYANGGSLPPATKLGFFAKTLQVPEIKLRKLVARERDRRLK